jgi:class 3 adenylate cyclase
LEEWLRSIDLARRVAAFREHGITPDQLAELTDEDLRELGLTIGERLRFRRALAGQQGISAVVPQATPAERRPLTVMFVDLADSTALGERLDPEDLIEVIRNYRELSGEAIDRYGGNIARFIGDGILAYFCYPMANENDPERAVRAALDIVHGIGNVQTPDGGPVEVRIGIATGPVIIGDLFAGAR